MTDEKPGAEMTDQSEPTDVYEGARRPFAWLSRSPLWIITLSLVALAASSVYSTYSDYVEEDPTVAEAIVELTKVMVYDGCLDRIWAHNDRLATLQSISGSTGGGIVGEEGRSWSIRQFLLWDADRLADADWPFGQSIFGVDSCGSAPEVAGNVR